MDGNKATLILLGMVLLACFMISVKCDEGDSDWQTPAAAGGLSQQPDDGEAMTNSSKIVIELCFRRTCSQNRTNSCYCCGLLPDQPCYLDQKQCWRICPQRQAGALTPNSQLVPRGVNYPRKDYFDTCNNIC